MPIEPVRLRLHEIRLPLREPFAISSGVVQDRRILLVEVTDADGGVAWGECVAGERPNYSPETVDTASLAVRSWIAPEVLGRSFDTAGDLARALATRIQGHQMARAAVEMAAWALEADRTGVSLARHLGGTRARIPIGISLGLQNHPDALVARARAARDQGYRRVKLKIAPGRDHAYVAAVRETLGADVALSVDANAAYTLEDTEHLTVLDRFALVMIEQPLRQGDLRRHAALQARLRTPLCLDESITCPEDAQDAVALGSARVVNIKPGRVGGFAAARAIHDVCAAAGMPVWCGGMLESGIGRAHNVALASLPNFALPGDLSPSARYWERDIVTPEWTMDADGFGTVPLDRAGLGVRVDRDRIDDLTTAMAELHA
jgi:O-succinylbenzoate synthase